MNPELSLSSENNPLHNRQPIGKRWKAALKRHHDPTQRRLNAATELKYKEVLTKVKALLAPYHEKVFERDLREDNAENAFAMHAFLSSSFYFFLECDYVYEYKVEYAFNFCPVEDEIRIFLQSDPLDQQAKEVNLQPDFKTFYNTVLNIQDSKFIYSL